MLTFEMIRELERNERSSKKLQHLPENIKDELREYIKRKEKLLDKSTSDILELENVKNTIKRFYEIREDKATAMALAMARTGLSPENLTSDERYAFDGIVEVLKTQREAFFFDINNESAQEKKTEEPGEAKGAKDAKEAPASAQGRTIYRVTRELQEFIGPDMKTYRLIRGEIVNLPKPLNDLLLKEGVIEELQE